MMTGPSPPPEIEIHEIEDLDLRTVFPPGEAKMFTPWLGRPENLARLARALGIDLAFGATEVSSGTFRADILARNLADDTMVVIENQFGRSDHDHFGKAMTYLAAHGAKTVVWIAEAFADEHRAALSWLNENTTEDIRFYGVVPRLMRIAGSPPGLRIEVVIAPNEFVKQQKRDERKIDSAIADIRDRFWRAFNAHLQADSALSGTRLRFGGRLGFQWIFPDIGAEWVGDEPHVLVFIGAGRANQVIGAQLECARAAKPQAEERLLSAREALRARGIPMGATPADFSDPAAMGTAVRTLVERAKAGLEELSRAFGE
jgi:hypothetical protein